MRWSGDSNPALVDAIIASFQDSPELARDRLSQFNAKDWDRTEIWLNTGGLALYFFQHLCAAGISDAIEPRMRQKLQQNLADNKARTADMLREFVAINHTFQGAGMRYANLKGFTLFPGSCPDLSLRHQSDFDFLVDPAHLHLGRGLLECRGYELVSSTEHTLEFKSGNSQSVTFEAHYKVNPIRSVELHITMGSIDSIADAAIPDERLDRLTNWTCDEGSFPALSPVDQLICQAIHLLAHLRSEHTRPSWLLEYRNHILARRAEDGFWRELRCLAGKLPDACIALGLATRLTTDLFGPFSSPQLDSQFNSWTLDVLPRQVGLWADIFGRRAVLADVPGTKLYLFLDSALRAASPFRPRQSHASRLLPLHGPPRILRPPPHDTLRLRTHRELIQLRYVFYRLNFHLKQGARYALDAIRWRRLKRPEVVPHLQTNSQPIVD